MGKQIAKTKLIKKNASDKNHKASKSSDKGHDKKHAGKKPTPPAQKGGSGKSGKHSDKSNKHASKPVAKDQKHGHKGHVSAKPTHAKGPSKVEAKHDKKSHVEKPAKPVEKTNEKAAKHSVVPEKVDKANKKGKGKSGKSAGKGKNDELDMEDDLVGDEELGGEELPDLSEFDQVEIEIEETEEVVVDASDMSRPADDEVILTDAEGRRYCRVRDCDQISVVEGYCRYHYLLLWKKIQVRRKILSDGKLERYVEELTSRYPDKFLEMIRKDLRSEKEFLAAIAELEIDESAVDSDFEDESASFIEEVRGISDGPSSHSDDDEY